MSNIFLDTSAQITYFPYSTLSTFKKWKHHVQNNKKKIAKDTILEQLHVLFTAPVK